MKIYGVYENDEYQECRFVGTAKELMKEFGCDRSAISHAVTRRTKFRKKYKILVVYDERS